MLSDIFEPRTNRFESCLLNTSERFLEFFRLTVICIIDDRGLLDGILVLTPFERFGRSVYGLS